ncbi:MAG: DUF3341 domain-containing protein [Bdellovibrionales bacterium]
MVTWDQTEKRGHKAVFGIFNERFALERSVQTLKDSGFRNSDISVLLPSTGTMGDGESLAHERGSKAPEGAATGATSGIAIGGTLGWLVGLGSLAIPGLGPFVAAGPIMAAIAGAGIGATVGGVAGALIGLGIPEYEAKRYETSVRVGNHLLSVHVDDAEWADRAKSILEASGAHDISTVGEVKDPHTPPLPFPDIRPTF